MKIYGGAGSLSLISSAGTICATTGNTRSTKLDDSLLLSVRSGEKNIAALEGRLIVLEPMAIGSTSRPWAVITEVPRSRITAGATSLMWKEIGIGITCLLGTLILLGFMAGGIARPINRIIEGMKTGAEQVASASHQVSSSSQQMAEAASEQASSLEETSSSLEEMASMTSQNAYNAGQASALASDARDASQRGNDTAYTSKEED